MTPPEPQLAKPTLSVSYHNFWPGFDAGRSFFTRALSARYDVRIDAAGRDLQISSVFHPEPLPQVAGSRPLRVWYTGENRFPREEIFDLHFGFHPSCILASRWFRLPIWVVCVNWWDADSPHHVEKLLGPRSATKRSRFCNFIYSAPAAIRGEFFLRLNELRHVDSCGRVLNNCGWRPGGLLGKMEVLTDSVFTIAFENHMAPGYVTEKLLEPLLAGSIPIYWGPAEARSDFNPQAFLFAEDFESLDALARHVVSLADSEDRLREFASARPFVGDKIPYEHTPDFFVDRIGDALSGKLAATIPAAWSQQNLRRARPVKSAFKRWRRKVKDAARSVRRKVWADV